MDSPAWRGLRVETGRETTSPHLRLSAAVDQKCGRFCHSHHRATIPVPREINLESRLR